MEKCEEAKGRSGEKGRRGEEEKGRMNGMLEICNF